MDNDKLKKMKFLFHLKEELDAVSMTADELVAILSETDGHDKIDVAGRESVDRIPETLKDKDCGISSTAVQPDIDTGGNASAKDLGGNASADARAVISTFLRRTVLADDLTDVAKDLIHMTFFEGLDDDDNIITPAVSMHRAMMHRTGKDFDIGLVYSLRTCYSKYLKQTGRKAVSLRRAHDLRTIDKDNSIRNLLYDLLNDSVRNKDVIKVIKKKFGVDITKEQVKYFKKVKESYIKK
ncbi:hypothetical protein GQ472_01875 [archaeon]|nr:hypothetical protein [archaeon]